LLISAVRRTGSTLPAELLTELPRTFVLRKPKLFRSEPDAGLLAQAEEAGRLLGSYHRLCGYDGE
jgi:hypothetical protein